MQHVSLRCSIKHLSPEDTVVLYKTNFVQSVGECMSHLIISLFKYKLKLMRVDRHIMLRITLNWTSLNNTYCQTVHNPVEMFVSASLRSRVKRRRLLSAN